MLRAAAEATLLWLLLIEPFLVTGFRVTSPSMAPTLRIGDRVLASPVPTRYLPLRRGEIAVFSAPHPSAGRARRHVKRIVALGGDRLAIRSVEAGDKPVLVLDGRARDEPYVHEPMAYGYPRAGSPEDELTVPAETVFVLGDNRNASNDSRSYGCVPVSSVTHRVLLVVGVGRGPHDADAREERSGG